MELGITFEQGRMDSDSDPAGLSKGVHIESENIDFFSGSAIPMKGMSSLTSLGLSNAKSLGKLAVPSENKIYNLYKADNDEGIYEYDTETKEVKFLLRSYTGKLGFSTKIPRMNLVDDFIFWSGDSNPPRRVDRTISYTPDGFEEKDISVIKPAPLNPPTLVLSTNLTGENNIENKYIEFFTRYKYITGEYSAFSSASRMAFLPKSFDYNYATHTNNGMVNRYNSVEIVYNTGDRLVEEVQLLFRETGSNSVFLIDSFDKVELGYDHEASKSYIFTNNKRYKVLPSDQLPRMFDNVPLEAKTQEVIGNRILYGNYTDGYDLVDSNNNKIDFQHSVEIISEDTASPTAPKESVKVDRDYEIAMVYSDGESRMATPVVSRTNTVYNDISNSVKKNSIKVTVPHVAPEFARSYRFFIKQSKIDYDVIIPSLFYEDGVYVWIKYEEADKDKITVGDYLVVKRDTSGLLERKVEVRILEAGYKEGNWLRPEFTGVAETDAELRKITQKAGYYFKIKPEKFVMDISDLETLEDKSYHNTRTKYEENVNQDGGETGVSISKPVFYGINLEGITSGGSYVPPDSNLLIGYRDDGNLQDVRFKITIGGDGMSFTWECDAEVTVPPSGGGVIDQEGGVKVLSGGYGVSVTFPDRTSIGSWQYTPDEYFVVSAKTKLNDSGSLNRALACLEGFPSNEEIEGGAQIQLWVKEYGGNARTVIVDEVYDLSSSKQYENLEEWWHEESIDLGDIDEQHIFFRRGWKEADDSSYKFFENNGITDGVYDYPMHMFIRGQVPGGILGNKVRGKIASSIKIIQNVDGNSFPILETRPIDEIDNDLFYEIGDTYLIDEDGYHLGGDVVQILGTPAEITLNYFNCFSYGNGVESYKVRDGFNQNKLSNTSRALVPIEDYKRTQNETDFIYSGVFSKSTKINKLNEFNLSNLNFKELSTKQEGPIRFLATRKGDVLVFQHSLTSKVLFGKTLLSSIDGTQIIGSEDVLGSQTFYSKKFGIGDNAESYAEYGNNFYYVDPNSASFVRGGYSGLDEIVNGQKNYFKEAIRCNPDNIQGVYDLRQDAYIASVDGILNYYKESASGWTTRVSRDVDMMLSMNNRTFAFCDGDIFEFYVGSYIGGSIKTVINDYIQETKTFESLRLHSNYPLEIDVSSDHGASTVVNFEKRENFWHGAIPKSTVSFSNRYGIGSVDSVSYNRIKMTEGFNSRITEGDLMETEDGVVGTILSVVGRVITVSGKDVPVSVGTFVLGSKNSSIEGDSIRGATAILDIKFDSGKDHKLLTINADIDKSFN